MTWVALIVSLIGLIVSLIALGYSAQSVSAARRSARGAERSAAAAEDLARIERRRDTRQQSADTEWKWLAANKVTFRTSWESTSPPSDPQVFFKGLRVTVENANTNDSADRIRCRLLLDSLLEVDLLDTVQAGSERIAFLEDVTVSTQVEPTAILLYEVAGLQWQRQIGARAEPAY